MIESGLPSAMVATGLTDLCLVAESLVMREIMSPVVRECMERIYCTEIADIDRV